MEIFGYSSKWSDDSDEIYGYVRNIPINDFNKIYFKESIAIWLASPYDDNGLVARSSADKNSGSIDSYYTSETIAGRLRPVVCLKSNVELKKVGEETYAIK